MPSWRNSDAAYGAGVDDLFYAGLLRRGEKVARALDVGIVKFLRVARPEPIVRGHVKDQFAACDRAFERCGIAQIAGEGLVHLKILQPAGRANQGADAMSLLSERLGNVPAKKS